MAYNTFEQSIDSGSVVELYEFTQGFQVYRFSSCESSIDFDYKTYKPFTAKRNSIKQTHDVFKDSLSMSFPRGDVFASQFLGFAPEDVTTLTIRRGHFGDVANEFIVYWKGRIVGAKTSGNEITIDCESVFTSIKRPGLRARYEYGCRRVLYRASCGVAKISYKYIGLLTNVAGSTLTIDDCASQPDGYFTGGMVIAPNGASRFITNHVGDLIYISRPITGLVAGGNIEVYPGCDHLKETCNAKFNNLNNFGGFPWIPSRNPFDGSSIV